MASRDSVAADCSLRCASLLCDASKVLTTQCVHVKQLYLRGPLESLEEPRRMDFLAVVVPRGEMVLQVHQTNVSIYFCTISSPASDGVQGTSLLEGFLCQMILLALMLKAVHEETNRKETEHQEKVKDMHTLKYLVLKIILADLKIPRDAKMCVRSSAGLCLPQAASERRIRVQYFMLRLGKILLTITLAALKDKALLLTGPTVMSYASRSPISMLAHKASLPTDKSGTRDDKVKHEASLLRIIETPDRTCDMAL
ncbi:hypothetical protein MUG91_G47n4 [Manis pentadactyla]|nr:hypothetical protein MUG91_G47n4 [Manis pentadactyla]